jgi:hypothetical protein
MRVREAVDFTGASHAAGSASVFIRRSGFVADETAELRQCSGVAGPCANSLVRTRRDADVTGRSGILRM